MGILGTDIDEEEDITPDQMLILLILYRAGGGPMEDDQIAKEYMEAVDMYGNEETAVEEIKASIVRH